MKIIAIVGPTASGKSELAVALAKKYNGEIISCDSRQIYRGLDIGTGKINGHWIAVHPQLRQKSRRTPKILGRERKAYIYRGVVHQCLDIVNPTRQYSAALFQRDANKAVANIIRRGKLPILCGGTAHWMDAVVYDQTLPEVKPNPALRKKLEQLSTGDLFARIRARDPARAKTIDKHNRRRLIRALEIIISTGKPVPSLPLFSKEGGEGNSFDVLWLGISLPRSTLYKRINRRLRQRLKAGMMVEVKKLHTDGLSWKRLESFGLEYKYVSLFLRNTLTRQQMTEQLSLAIKRYSKRQLTWWKRNRQIHWIKSSQAEKLIENFLQ